MNIRSELREKILIVTIDRPEAHNALSQEMSRRLISIWKNFRDDPACRVAVLTGAGETSFCAGADLKEVGHFYRSMTSEERRERARTGPGLGGITRNLDPGKPVIAAINGHCLGGGLELALACDIRIASEVATFGLPEVLWGLMPGAGGSQRLPRTVPLTIAMEMLLTGATIDAGAAFSCGLVSRVVPPEKLLAEALTLARRIVRAAPLSVKAVRAAAYQGLELALDDGLELEQEYAEPLRKSADVQEGLKAFVEKRDPEWTGR